MSRREPEPPAIGDIAELRKQGDLRLALTHVRQEVRDRNAARRAAVLRHPDLAEKLTQQPHCWTEPGRWNGYVPPATWNQAPNTSPVRRSLVALVAEAERRDATRQQRSAA